MVGVAQVVRASGCGPEGRGFKSPHSPQLEKLLGVIVDAWGLFFVYDPNAQAGCDALQSVTHDGLRVNPSYYFNSL